MNRRNFLKSLPGLVLVALAAKAVQPEAEYLPGQFLAVSSCVPGTRPPLVSFGAPRTAKWTDEIDSRQKESIREAVLAWLPKLDT